VELNNHKMDRRPCMNSIVISL